MCRKLLVVPCLAFPALVVQTAIAAEPLPPARQWIPADTVIAVELSAPDALLDLALNPRVAAAVTSIPAYQELTAQPDFKQFLQVLALVETTIETDWKSGLRKLVGGGVTFAAGADGAVLLIIDTKDGEMLERLHEMFLGFARAEAEKDGDPDRVASREYRGVTAWTFGGDEVHAIVGNRLLVSNRRAALEAALDLRAKPEGRSLASSPAYRQARKAAGANAAATVVVNLEALEQNPAVRDALAQGPNPAASLLIPGVTEALRASRWLTMGLYVQDDTLELRAVVDGKAAGPSGPASFAWSRKAGEGALPNLSVPRQIAGLSFYRDLETFYASKDDLFPDRTSGLIFFENMMGIFFSGRDLTEEVLAQTRPEIRFVVAEQAYDPSVGTPRIQLPSFAAVFRLRDPEKFTIVIEEAWQKALGLINFTRGQQALPGLIIDRPTHGDTKFTMAYFVSSDEGAKKNVDSRFNFRPALAVLGEHLILSSTEDLARDLIDALKKEIAEPVKALAQVHSLVQIDGAQVASILRANRENLVRQNMVNDGSTREQAELQMDLLTTIVNYLGEAKLNLGRRDGRMEARLALKLNLP